MTEAELLAGTKEMMKLAKNPSEKTPLPFGWSSKFVPTLADFLDSEGYPTLLGKIYSLIEKRSGSVAADSIGTIISWLFEWVCHSYNKVSSPANHYLLDPIQTRDLYYDPIIKASIPKSIKPNGITLTPLRGTTYISQAYFTTTMEASPGMVAKERLSALRTGQVVKDIWDEQLKAGRRRVQEILSGFFPGLPSRLNVDYDHYKPFILLPRGLDNPELTTIKGLKAFRVPVTKEQLVCLSLELFPVLKGVHIEPKY